MTLIATQSDVEAAGTAEAGLPHIHILADRCAGCQECIVRCPVGALRLDPATWTVLADDAACVGCRQCVRTCPFSAIVIDGPLVVQPRVTLGPHHPKRLARDTSETRPGIATWAEALAEASRCLDCPDPTCVRGCPAHNDIPGFIRAIKAGDLDQAHQVLRRTSVLPDVCSRVCDQALQCEGACTWSLGDGVPVAIGALERFVSDNAPLPPIGASGTTGAGMDVAIVGSGPAGIAAAYELAGAGAKVTVYEREEEPGGLLRWGIPDFTLPEPVSRRPWEALRATGVVLHTGHEVLASDLDELTRHFDAVLFAPGASTPLRLAVAGGDLEGVWDATRFLTEAHAALVGGTELAALRPQRLPAEVHQAERAPTVLVLGAGNTAMDVARSARRLGARALCVDWMDPRFAPVRPDELDEAAAEGVEVRFSTTVERLEGLAGHVERAHLAHTIQHSATKRPKVLPGDSTVERVDLVVMAMGYRIAPDVVQAAAGVPVAKALSAIPDRRWQASGILANASPEFARHQPIGALALGREHAVVIAGLARRDRVWVAGDALVGPSSVVEAMAQGKRAAQSILHHGPRRPDRPRRPARRVLVAVESRGGTTATLAKALAEGLASEGAEVRFLRLAQVGAGELAWADAMVVGTWVEGLVIARVGPARVTRSWLATLPPLGAMPVALLCTYAVSPGRTLAAMRSEIECHGGRVVAEGAFSRRLGAPERDRGLRSMTQAVLC